MVNINCEYNDRGTWCTNTKVKRSLFGFGARCCILFDRPFSSNCKYQLKYKRPSDLPPAPPISNRKEER